MNGIGIGQLNVYKVAGNRFHLLLNKSGDHKDRWNYVAIHFNSTQPYQVIKLRRSFLCFRTFEIACNYLLSHDVGDFGFQ